MNRKATFAKRQREMDLKEHARNKAARAEARKDNPRSGKGPEIAWDEMVRPTETTEEQPDADTGVFANDHAGDTPPAPSGGGTSTNNNCT